LQDISGTCGIIKTGPDRLRLNGLNTYGPVFCTNYIAEGTVIRGTCAAMGSSPALIVVSNGASLQFGAGMNIGFPLLLNGSGVANSGAFRFTGSYTPVSTWSGSIELASDATIVQVRGNWTRQGGPTLLGHNHNLTTPLADWILIADVVADAGGRFQFVDSNAPNRQRSYRFGQ
jgi:hypothetical protein